MSDNSQSAKFFSDNKYPSHKLVNKSIRQIRNENDERILIEHPCQRKYIWNNKTKQAFLTTISKKGPISGLQYNMNDIHYCEITDGQNRINTIIEFMDDKFLFENDKGIKMKYSHFNEDEKREFLSIDIHFIETSNWNTEECEEHFRMIQEGFNLTQGEIINSSSSNIVTKVTKKLDNEFNTFIRGKPKDKGMNIHNNRYKHLETLTTLVGMCMQNEVPQKSTQISKKYFEEFDNLTDEKESRIKKASSDLVELFNQYEKLVKSIPELQKGTVKKDNWHSCTNETNLFRNLYFMFKSDIYKDPITPTVIKKFQNMLKKTHSTQTSEDSNVRDQISVLANKHDPDGCIYEIYLKFYNSK